MPWLDASWNTLPRTDEPEQIDDPLQPPADIARSMRDLALTNALFGGVYTVLSHATRLLQDVPRDRPARVLDIATGSGDIPHALLAWAKRARRPLSVVAVDNLESMLALARPQAPQAALVRADARALPFAPRSFDIALCSLAFHHLGFDASADVLRAMDTLTTYGFVVSDLRRDKVSLLGVQIGLKLMRAHSFTQHDGPASVRRAFTPREYERMVITSGAQGVQVRSWGHFRMALVQRKGQSAQNGYVQIKTFV